MSLSLLHPLACQAPINLVIYTRLPYYYSILY